MINIKNQSYLSQKENVSSHDTLFPLQKKKIEIKEKKDKEKKNTKKRANPFSLK